MTISSLPPHLRDKANWIKTDQNVWYKWWWLNFKLRWLSFGPRSEEKWARFREYPKTLFMYQFGGQTRYENTDGTLNSVIPRNEFYLSRIQPWCRFMVYLNWPFYFHIHFFYLPRYVLKEPNLNTNTLNILKMITFAFGFKRDGDRVYWLTAFLGGRFE